MKIWTPATSANLGPGFDAMGMALSMGNQVEIEASERSRMQGQPAYITRIEDHLIYKAMVRAWEEMGRKPRPVSLTQQDAIPGSRGLGSSAACIAAGVAAANALEGRPLSRRDCVELSAAMEGHPDNVLPAWEGGVCVGVMEGKRVDWVRLDPPQGLYAAALIPNHPLPTAKARAVLPPSVPRADGVFNAGRAALLAAALASGKLELLGRACQDRLHQGYRAALIPDYDEVIRRVEAMGAAAAFLSGAGPTIMSLWLSPPPPEAALEAALAGLAWQWKAKTLSIVDHGVRVEPGRQ